MNTKAQVVRAEDHTPPLQMEQQSNADGMLSNAIATGIDPEGLRTLVELRATMMADEARKAYYGALASFQAALPPIVKSKVVQNKDKSERYRYAPLDAIIEQVKDALLEQGFSYRFHSQTVDDVLEVSCTVMHRMGHTETSTVKVPTITGYGTNAAQDAGSAATYGKRYSFCDALGISTADADNDGATSGPDNAIVLLRHNKAVRENIDSIVAIKTAIACDDLPQAFEYAHELDGEAQSALWVAETKGGIWTTAERTAMKSNEWAAIRRSVMGAEAG